MEGEVRAPEPIRWPLAVPLSARNANVSQDAFLFNCFIEPANDGSGRKYVVKRPGCFSVYSFAGGGAVTSQALVSYKDFLLAAASNTLYNLDAPVSNNNATGTAWTQTTNAPWAARYSFGCCVFKNQIWVVGGRDAGVNVFNDVWSSADGETWTQVVSAAPWTRRQAAALVATNDKMYLIGGIDGPGTYRNDVWVTEDGVTWNQLTNAAPWAGRAGHNACAFNNGIMLMGGINSGGYLNDVWFSTDGTNWNQQVVNASWAARANFGLLVFGVKMYVLGGNDGATAYNQVYSTPDGITWTLESAAPWANALAYMGACVYDGKMYVLGGTNSAGTYYNDIYSTTSGTGVWTVVSTAPGWGNRAKFGCVAFRAPSAVTSLRLPIMWIMGGDPGANNEVWRANINGANNATWSIPTSGTNLPMDVCTANANDYLVFKDTAGMYVLWGNNLSKVTDKNYPAVTVRGVVNLDETVYVMDPTGIIYGSALENPFIYPSFNFIGADYESDKGVAIAKYLNYLVAFGVFTTQLFYNSGVGPSLLRPVQNANIRIGCAFADSVTTMQANVYWVGRDKDSLAYSVYRFNGMRPEKVSDPYLERFLLAASVTNIKGTCLSLAGHNFYIITVVGSTTRSFVFDSLTGVWHRWESFQAGSWTLGFVATNPILGTTSDLALHNTTGRVYQLSGAVFDDDGGNIVCQGQTNIQDGGTTLYKFCGRAVVVGDRAVGSLITLSFTDDDYQTSVVAGVVSMDQAAPSIPRVGRFRRRAWSWLHSNQTALRLEAIEAYTDVGNT